MISIIISSADSDQLYQATENIAATIGVAYEIIAIENNTGQQGICAVYNSGIKKAKYDVLCFMHEDLIIKADGWGNTVLNIFNENKEYGLIGVAGSSYKTLTPSGWSGSGSDTIYSNIIQSYKYQQNESDHYYNNPGGKKLQEVVCIDGLWFCVPKKIAAEFMFDEETFKGFHVYDLDFSFSVRARYKIAVTFDILIHHLSEGNYGTEWLTDTLKFQEKFNAALPANLQLTHKQAIHGEKATFKFFIDRLLSLNIPISVAFNVLYYKNRFLKLDAKLFVKLHFYIIKKYLKAKPGNRPR